MARIAGRQVCTNCTLRGAPGRSYDQSMGARSAVFVVASCALAGCALAGCSFSGPGEAPVDVAPEVDAPPIDAPPIDAPPVDCPNDYQAVTGLTSRYRLTGESDYETRHDDCKNDRSGKTHLVVIDSPQELAQLRISYNQDWWAGAVQAPGQPAPILGWFHITGAPVPMELWAPAQPNDDNNIENDAQNAAFRTANGLEDESGLLSRPGLCECDGVPIDSTVEGYVPDTDD